MAVDENSGGRPFAVLPPGTNGARHSSLGYHPLEMGCLKRFKG